MSGENKRHVDIDYCLGCVWVEQDKSISSTIFHKKYAHSFVVLCFVVVMQSFIMNSHEVFIHIHQGCFAGTGAIVRLPQCQWSKPDGYGKISQCITTTKHTKAKTVCIFLGKYCTLLLLCGANPPVKGLGHETSQCCEALILHLSHPQGIISWNKRLVRTRVTTGVIMNVCRVVTRFPQPSSYIVVYIMIDATHILANEK